MPPIPTEMTAMAIDRPGGPEVLTPVRRPVPLPQPGEVLIGVRAAGVNRPDLLQRLGRYPLPPGASDLPGLEVAGEIAALGAGASGFEIGDAVTALCNGGGYADYVAVPAGQVLPVPAGLDWVVAAAVPETYFTVWTNVFDRGRFTAGETLLVHGGASGIGTTAIQLATALGGTVFTTIAGTTREAALTALGARRVIDHSAEDFVAVIDEATSGRGVDVVLDMVGGDYTARNLACLAVEGRLVQIAFLRGSDVAISLEPVMRRRLTITGSTLRPQSAAAKAAIAASLKDTVWPLLATGRVRPVIQATYPLRQAAEAHRLLEAGQHLGKIVLVTE